MALSTRIFLFITFITLFNLNWANASELANYKQQIEASLNTLKQTNKARNWAYTRTTEDKNQDEKQLTIESFDPSKTPLLQWTLIQDEGKKPSEKEQKTYRQQQLKKFQQAQEKEQDEQQNLIDMIDFASLKLVSESDQQAILSFSPQLKRMGEDSKQHLNGELIFDKTTNHVQQLNIKNTADLSPALSVTIKQFSMKFQLTAKEQALLPEKIAIDIYGKAAVFTTIDQKTIEKYSNYQYVGAHTSKKP